MKNPKLLAGLLAAMVLAVVFAKFDVQEGLRQSLDWVDGLGAIAPVVFSGIYIGATVLFLPGAILTLGAGVLFGVVKGSIVVSVASTLGATGAFLAGRYLARGWVAHKIGGNASFKAIDEAVGREGWKIVGLTRLSPVFPFNLLNYAYGLTRVSLRDYFWASWIGMMPGTIMYVYIGSLAGSLATLGAGHERSPMEWALYGAGLLATVLVTIYVTKIARSSLEKRIEREK